MQYNDVRVYLDMVMDVDTQEESGVAMHLMGYTVYKPLPRGQVTEEHSGHYTHTRKIADNNDCGEWQLHDDARTSDIFDIRGALEKDAPFIARAVYARNKEPGPSNGCGLLNHGRTCYMNVGLRELHLYASQWAFTACSGDSLATKILKDIIKGMGVSDPPRKVLSPKLLRKAMVDSLEEKGYPGLFPVGADHDAEEFLKVMIDESGSPELAKMVSVQLSTQQGCSTCHRSAERLQPCVKVESELTLSLPLPSDVAYVWEEASSCTLDLSPLHDDDDNEIKLLPPGAYVSDLIEDTFVPTHEIDGYRCNYARSSNGHACASKLAVKHFIDQYGSVLERYDNEPAKQEEKMIVRQVQGFGEVTNRDLWWCRSQERYSHDFIDGIMAILQERDRVLYNQNMVQQRSLFLKSRIGEALKARKVKSAANAIAQAAWNLDLEIYTQGIETSIVPGILKIYLNINYNETHWVAFVVDLMMLQVRAHDNLVIHGFAESSEFKAISETLQDVLDYLYTECSGNKNDTLYLATLPKAPTPQQRDPKSCGPLSVATIDQVLITYQYQYQYHYQYQYQYHIISHHITSYHIISHHIISHHITSYHIISYHIISYHIISYHIISYHIISYHIIPYHITHIIS
jgi:hypothetical protein